MMKKRCGLFLCVFAVGLMGPLKAHAQQSEAGTPPRHYYQGPYGNSAPDPGAHVHDGAFVRLQLGFGYTRMSTDAGVKVAGQGGAFGISIGGSVSRNLVIYGTLLDSVALNPSVTGNAVSAHSSSTIAGVFAVGAGLAYYTDDNIFVAMSGLGSRLVMNSDIGHSDWGFTFDGQLGKEWWASDNWGLGLSAQLLLGSMGNSRVVNYFGNDPTWGLLALNLLFSATYN